MDLGSQDLVNGSVPIGRDFATRILAEYAFEGQRKVYPQHVKLLVGLMEKGEWLDNDQLTFCRLPCGKMLLINGYHRMHAVIAFGKPVTFDVRILPAHDMDAVRRAYVTFDTMIRRRGDGEVIHAMGVLESYGLSKQVAESVYRAAPYLANKFGQQYYTNNSTAVRDITGRMTMADAYWQLGRVYQDLIEPATHTHKRKMLLPPVVAVALVTIKHQPVVAEKFWPAVASMAGLDGRDPRLTLAKYLGEKRYLATKSDSVPESAHDAAVCWNAFFEKRELTIIRKATAFRIAGTTWR